MPRAIWTGSIGFGLVNVPVALYSAIEQKDVHFHQMTKSGHRVRNKRVDERTGREVEYEDLVRGYELRRGSYVLVEPGELDAAAPDQTRTIAIEDFVDLGEIDPIFFDATYYLAPPARTPDSARKAYALLREALDRTEKVGIGRFVMRTKQYLVAVRPVDRLLYLETLFFADEVRSTGELDAPSRLRGATRELKIAEQLIDNLTTEWKPSKYKDTYRADVLRIIKRKQQGKEIVAEEPAQEPAPVTDLMEALRASIDRRKSRRSHRGRSRRRAS